MYRNVSLTVALVSLALAGRSVRAQQDPQKPRECAPGEVATTVKPCAPPPAAQATVRKIHVVTQNIFDPAKPGEDKALFRLANRFHFVTRPEVIERQVLLKPGDVYSPEEAAESERILRQNRYLYDAQIHPVPVGDGQVDLNVITRDVWTDRKSVV